MNPSVPPAQGDIPVPPTASNPVAGAPEVGVVPAAQPLPVQPVPVVQPAAPVSPQPVSVIQPVPVMPVVPPAPPVVAAVPTAAPAVPIVSSQSSPSPSPVAGAAPAMVSPKTNDKRSSLALAALLVGITAIGLEIFMASALRLLIFVAPVSLAAIGLGIPALGSARRGLAIAGVVLGSLSLIAVIILFTVGQSIENRCRTNVEFAASSPQCQGIQLETVSQP